jgi:hypothetical protein
MARGPGIQGLEHQPFSTAVLALAFPPQHGAALLRMIPPVFGNDPAPFQTADRPQCRRNRQR